MQNIGNRQAKSSINARIYSEDHERLRKEALVRDVSVSKLVALAVRDFVRGL